VSQSDAVGWAAYGLPTPGGLLLAGEDGVARLYRGFLRLLQLASLATLRQRVLELIGGIEMVLEGTLVAAGDEDEFFDAGGQALLDGVLDQRPVDDCQHLLGHRLGGGQESGTQSRHRQDGFADALRHASSTSFHT